MWIRINSAERKKTDGEYSFMLKTHARINESNWEQLFSQEIQNKEIDSQCQWMINCANECLWVYVVERHSKFYTCSFGLGVKYVVEKRDKTIIWVSALATNGTSFLLYFGRRANTICNIEILRKTETIQLSCCYFFPTHTFDASYFLFCRCCCCCFFSLADNYTHTGTRTYGCCLYGLFMLLVN